MVSVFDRRPSGFRYNNIPSSIQDAGANRISREHSNKIVFDQSKGEQFTLLNGFKLLQKQLRSQWTLDMNTDELSDGTFEGVQIYVLPAPNAKFNTQEFDSMRKFVQSGGNLLVLMCEEGEQKLDTNINYLLEEFGIAVNADGVIRSVYYKYFDPKEALIPNGVLNRSLGASVRKQSKIDDNNSQSLTFVYPYGATLTLNSKQATALFSTGTVCYPVGRPVAAFHQLPGGGGKVIVLGSVHIFADSYLNKEENSKVLDLVMKLFTDEINLNPIDAAEPDVVDFRTVPDHMKLANELKACVQESEMEAGVGANFMKIFDNSLFSLDLELWPEVIMAYEKLSIPYEPLTVVKPALEVPLPRLQPATFPPPFRELPPPELELFDLDEAFSSAEGRLAQLATRCSEQDLDRFIKEAGDLLGIGRGMAPQERTSKRILELLMVQLVEFKRGQPDAQAVDDGHLFATVEEDGDDVHMEQYFSDLDEYDDLEP